MKVLLAALNAKYIHVSLAIRSLKACSQNIAEIEIRDYTINQEIQKIIADIYLNTPDIVGFSCYIWNIEMVLKIAASLKMLLPKCKILLGGPEVSYDAKSYLEKYIYLDAVICGEAEESFPAYIQVCISDNTLKYIPGLAYREDSGSIVQNQGALEGINLATLPFAYQPEELVKFKGKIIYYETSRGCAFSCAYCLSALDKSIRYLPFARVTQDLKILINAGIKQIKFVDRTFNASKKHAMEIWQFIVANFAASGTNFHFEIAVDLLDEEMLSFLKLVPPGLFQFEIGVQSTNQETLALVSRKTDLPRIFANVTRLKAAENIHLHLDLIAGLPQETMTSFAKSFNDVYNLGPHNLQLGFLKLLPGTKIKSEAKKYGIEGTDYPPYEVLKTAVLDYTEILELKEIENVLEDYSNSGHFIFFGRYLQQRWSAGAFAFFVEFVKFLKDSGNEKLRLVAKAQKLYEFSQKRWPEDGKTQRDILILDLLANQKQLALPSWLGFDETAAKKYSYTYLKDENFLACYLHKYSGRDWRALTKQLILLPCSSKVAKLIFQGPSAGSVLIDYQTNEQLTSRFAVTYLKYDLSKKGYI